MGRALKHRRAYRFAPPPVNLPASDRERSIEVGKRPVNHNAATRCTPGIRTWVGSPLAADTFSNNDGQEADNDGADRERGSGELEGNSRAIGGSIKEKPPQAIDS